MSLYYKKWDYSTLLEKRRLFIEYSECHFGGPPSSGIKRVHIKRFIIDAVYVEIKDRWSCEICKCLRSVSVRHYVTALTYTCVCIYIYYRFICNILSLQIELSVNIPLCIHVINSDGGQPKRVGSFMKKYVFLVVYVVCISCNIIISLAVTQLHLKM